MTRRSPGAAQNGMYLHCCLERAVTRCRRHPPCQEGWAKFPANAFEASGARQSERSLPRHLAGASTRAPRRFAAACLTALLVEDDAYAFARVTDGSRVVVVFNGAGASVELHVPLGECGIPNGTRMENLLGTTPAVEARQGALEIELPPHSAAIYR